MRLSYFQGPKSQESSTTRGKARNVRATSLEVEIIITFVLIQEKGFIESLLNWKTSTGQNAAQLPFVCHYTNFGNGECRPGIGLFTPFKNKFQ